MEKGKAFVVVGHKHWGKTKTLVELTGKRNGDVSIKKIKFKVNRPSNDDEAYKIIQFFAWYPPEAALNIIITLCPDFDEPSKRTVPILEFLKCEYDIYFWVMKKKWDTGEVIRQRDVNRLEKYGKVELFEEQVEPNIRAKKFKTFIESNL